MASVLPEKVSGDEMVVGMMEPFALVERSEESTDVRARLVVVAEPRTSKFPVVVAPPLIVSPVV